MGIESASYNFTDEVYIFNFIILHLPCRHLTNIQGDPVKITTFINSITLQNTSTQLKGQIMWPPVLLIRLRWVKNFYTNSKIADKTYSGEVKFVCVPQNIVNVCQGTYYETISCFYFSDDSVIASPLMINVMKNESIEKICISTFFQIPTLHFWNCRNTQNNTKIPPIHLKLWCLLFLFHSDSSKNEEKPNESQKI